MSLRLTLQSAAALALAAVLMLSLGCAATGKLASCSHSYPSSIASPISGLAVLKDYRTHRVSSEDRPGNFDCRRIEPHETLLLADLEGPGEITHIWTTIASPDPHHFRNLVLRVYYDGNSFPSVESPVGDFFGLGNNKAYVFNNPVQAIGTDKGLNAFWPMPFKKSARLEVINESDIRTDAYYYYVDWRKFKKMPRDLAYFHAQYRQDFPCTDGNPYLILDTGGAPGHFVGVNLSIHTQVGGWWGEGDDIFTVDGESRPSLWGTGSEDYFCGAWGFGEAFYTPYLGMPYRERIDHDADNYWNVYRLHLENPVTFQESLKVQIEHGSAGFDNTRNNGRNNDYSSVAYWYTREPVPLRGSLAPASERLSEYRPLIAPDNVLELDSGDRVSTPSKGVSQNSQDMGAFSNQTDKQWFHNDHLFAATNVDGSRVAIQLDAKKDLSGPAVLRLTQAPDYARLRIRLDGEILVDNFNAYHPTVRPFLFDLGERALSQGPHTLDIETIGKDERSSNCLWGLDYLRVGGDAPAIEKAAE